MSHELTDLCTSPAITSEKKGKCNVKEPEKEKQKLEKDRLLLEKKLKKEADERDREEKRRIKEDERRKKEDERIKRDEDRKRKEQEREQDRLRKEEERRRREDEKKRKELEKEDERKKKEEERLKKDGERILKEMEKKKEEEERSKKVEKQRAILFGFLVKSNEKLETSEPHRRPESASGPFMKFELKKDMRIAPINRIGSPLLKEKKRNLDCLLESLKNKSATNKSPISSIGPPTNSLGLHKFGGTDYLHELRTGRYNPLSSSTTWPVEPPDLEEDETSRSAYSKHSSLNFRWGDRGDGGTVWIKTKFLHFVENHRPAYYGTWRRRSHVISGRRPFAKDIEQLDYEVDSDDEWEEEDPGESITQSEGEEEDEDETGKDEAADDEDDCFFVPHGYLSDDEGVEEAEIDPLSEGGFASEALEMKKLRQRLSLVEYEAAHKRGLQKLRSVCIGPVWLADPPVVNVEDLTNHLQADPTAPASAAEATSYLDFKIDVEENKENVELGFEEPVSAKWTLSGKPVDWKQAHDALRVFKVYIWDSTLPIAIPIESFSLPTPISRTAGRQKLKIPEEGIPYLIQLVHRSNLGRGKLAFEFRVFWQRFTSGTLLSQPESGKPLLRYSQYKRRLDRTAGVCGRTSLGDPSTPITMVGSGGGARKETTENATPPTSLANIVEFETLPLNQTRVLAKIGELFSFEENRWMVKPAVLRQYAPVMAEIFKMPSLLDLTESNPDIDWRQILSTLALPNWTYYTDVALGKQGKRASLNPCLSNNESSAPICAIGPVGSTPVSSVTSTSIEATPEQICTAVLPVSKRLSSASTGPPSGQRSLLACFQDSVGNENTLPMTYTSEAHALELEDLIILEPASSSSATQAVSVAGTTSPADQFPDSSRNSLTPGLTRKRITLECFFTPATPHLAKRRRARSQNEATEIEEKDKTDNVNEPSPCVALDYIVID